VDVARSWASLDSQTSMIWNPLERASVYDVPRSQGLHLIKLSQSGLNWAGLQPKGPRDVRSSEWPAAEPGSRESPSRTGDVAALRQLGSRAWGSLLSCWSRGSGGARRMSSDLTTS
jgi:hypothetical protein